jgi:nicotinate-nucleotide--dimethylbenzimidazole phosphoribosyltransferase
MTSLPAEAIQAAIDQKTKPLGALGLLEKIAFQLCCAQQTLYPSVEKPAMLVFAGDHGLAAEGVSAYPSEVTRQMVLNFLSGGAAINVFCRQHDIELTIVDTGIISPVPNHLMLKNQRLGAGTKNMRFEPAMSEEQLLHGLAAGAQLVKEKTSAGSNFLMFGEMGIGNTAIASLLMSCLLNLPLEDCVGAGTGLSVSGIQHKLNVLKMVRNRYPQKMEPMDTLRYFGGFEIVQMAGAMMEAGRQRCLFMVDGFIAGAAYLAALSMAPDISPFAIFSHQSAEAGHQRMLATLNAKPLLSLGLRLGEGTGCALAFPLVKSAAAMMSEMATFRQANVSTTAP